MLFETEPPGGPSFRVAREGVPSLAMLAAPHPVLKKESGVESRVLGRFDRMYLDPGSLRLRAALLAALAGLRNLTNSDGLHEENDTASSSRSTLISSLWCRPWYSASN